MPKPLRLAAVLLAVGLMAPAAAQVTAVMYHAHPNLGYSQSNFRDHMDFLVANGFHAITMDQFYDWHQNDAPLPLRPILITVDDNYILGYTEMYPILAERGLVATNYTHTLGIGIGQPKASWEQVNEMDAAGVFLLESHSRTHPDLSTLGTPDLVYELAGSRQDIADNANGKVSNHICYPYGRYSPVVMSQCQAAGYLTGLTTMSGLNYRDTPLFELRRFGGDGKNLQQFVTTIGFSNYPPPPPGEGWVLDDAEPHAYYDASRWANSTSPSGYFHTGHRLRQAGDAVMRWAALLPQGERMAVHARWTSGTDRAADAMYVIRHSGGDTEVLVDQRANGGQWVELGVFHFTEEEPVEVLLGGGSTGTLSADAIWFEPRAAQPADMWITY